MDISETYIKMSDYDEVQELAKLLSLESQQGSRYVKADDHKTIIWAANVITCPPAIKFIRLFRQDQLQEMIGNYEECKNALFEAGYLDNEYSKYWGMPSDYWEKFHSMEQLWLAFCMSKKFNKVWNGEDWLAR